MSREFKLLLCLALLALLVRLFLSWSWTDAADILKYRRVAETLAQGGQLYRDTPDLYPYPPLWAGVQYAALRLSENTLIPFRVWVLPRHQ